ncbi:MAG: dihydroorotate dehydrogenase catalytic subunit [Chloroflexota bacterium]|jgi:dihydroorotate dehydrogenase (NAD+) catalytic subunit|nr:dihydroorotate dehydrogenase catalytic subunit [Chloroflexota bacterium]
MVASPSTEVAASPIDVTVEIGVNAKLPLVLRNPVMVASGTFGYGTEYARIIDIQRLGAICSKGITARPRRGNRGPRVVETPAGMLNAIGLQNVGIHKVISDKAPLWAQWDVPVIANIAGDTVEEFAYMAEQLEGVNGVAGIELNISCPNVWEGGRVVGEDAGTAAAIVEAVRQRTGLPILVKLSPQVADIVGVALAAQDAGADALSMINTFVGMRIDTRTARPILANVTGGLSGPAILPMAVWLVYLVSQAVHIPIVGLGGIATTEDALEFILAGASAIQVGTMTFVEPRTALRIVDELPAAIAAHGCSSLHELVGTAHRTRG